jgi:hypothetical protein
MSPRPNPFGVIVPYLIIYNERVSQKKGFIHIFIIKLNYEKSCKINGRGLGLVLLKRVIDEQANRYVISLVPLKHAPSKPALMFIKNKFWWYKNKPSRNFGKISLV